MISTCSEDNLDPIEEVEDPDQQIALHLQQPPIIDCVSSTPPTGTIMILDCMLTYYILDNIKDFFINFCIKWDK